MKQRRMKGIGASCTCHPPTQITDVDRRGICRFGNCTEFRCPWCNAFLAGWGPVDCKCDSNIRWLRHPEMRERGHVARKPSLRGRHNRKRTRR